MHLEYETWSMEGSCALFWPKSGGKSKHIKMPRKYKWARNATFQVEESYWKSIEEVP